MESISISIYLLVLNDPVAMDHLQLSSKANRPFTGLGPHSCQWTVDESNSPIGCLQAVSPPEKRQSAFSYTAGESSSSTTVHFHVNPFVRPQVLLILHGLPFAIRLEHGYRG